MSAVDLYIAASSERDDAKRLAMLDTCFAANGRFVMRSRTLVGPAAVSAMIGETLANPAIAGVELTSAVDQVGTTFRYASVVVKHDGTRLAFFDAGEVGEDGKIVTMLVFAGTLQNA